MVVSGGTNVRDIRRRGRGPQGNRIYGRINFFALREAGAKLGVMSSFREMPFRGEVVRLLATEDSDRSIVSEAMDRVSALFEGFREDGHRGLTRPACTRHPYLYDPGTEIRNTRQLTVVSSEELRDIAGAMGLETLPAGWLGANIELSGVPDLTLLPPSSRLIIGDTATIVVDIENRPCALPARVIEGHHPGKGRLFQRHAMQRRGITAWVEREGPIRTGDPVKVFFPAQPAHPLQYRD